MTFATFEGLGNLMSCITSHFVYFDILDMQTWEFPQLVPVKQLYFRCFYLASAISLIYSN